MVACLKDFVSYHLHVHIFLKPHFIHNPEELKHKVVLSQVITILEHDLENLIVFLLFPVNGQAVFVLKILDLSCQHDWHLLTHEELAAIRERFNVLLGLERKYDILIFPLDLLALIQDSQALRLCVSGGLQVVPFLGLNTLLDLVNVEVVSVVVVTKIIFLAASLALASLNISV